MSIQSDLRLNASVFHPDAVDETTTSFVIRHREYEAGLLLLDRLKDRGKIQDERHLRRSRQKGCMDPSGQSFHITIPRSDSGEVKRVPVRMFQPRHSRGIFMHIHGGGWVLNDETSSDFHLKSIANNCNLTVISVGYRLAPESPFPKGVQDCLDVADYLDSNGLSEYGGELVFLGGESAGAHLAMLTYLHLLKHDRHCSIRGLSLPFGCYDLSYSPSLRNPTVPQSRFANTMMWYLCRFFNGKNPEAEQHNLERRRAADVSPLYADLKSLTVDKDLPPALFMCGTDDPLVDDSCFMAVRWQIAGGNGILKLHPGAWHGYIFHDLEDSPLVRAGREQLLKFVNAAMDRTI